MKNATGWLQIAVMAVRMKTGVGLKHWELVVAWVWYGIWFAFSSVAVHLSGSLQQNSLSSQALLKQEGAGLNSQLFQTGALSSLKHEHN